MKRYDAATGAAAVMVGAAVLIAAMTSDSTAVGATAPVGLQTTSVPYASTPLLTGPAAVPVPVGSRDLGQGASSGASREDIPLPVLTQTVRQYCVACHNDVLRTASLSLQNFDVATAALSPETAEIAEKMIGKLRTQMMPPPNIPRPGGDTLLALAEALETVIDDEVAANPNPGFRPFQRLNRVEYENTISDLLGLRVNAAEWLPLDTYLAHFDNMAVAQTLSPMLVNSYLSAANEVARLAVGQPEARAQSRTYAVSPYSSQHEWDRLDGAPYGTRGGVVVEHHFPADGNYVFDLSFWAGDRARFEDLDISINGEQVALVELEVLFEEGDFGPNWKMRTEPVFIPAGQHRLSAAFIRNVEGPYGDLIQPPEWSLAGTRTPVGYGTTLPIHLRELMVLGPYDASGVSETSARERLFTCRPATGAEARPCAESILTELARRAYRRPLTDRDVEGLMSFYDAGEREGGFETGVRQGLEAILASPHFFFRIEREPAGVSEGENYRLSDLDLASRLSFFLWGTPPDDELLDLAAAGSLSEPDRLEAQVMRMLEDPRSEALATRFAGQWLRLQDLDHVRPDAFWFPYFSEQLAADMRRETELFFEDLLRKDQSLLELYQADYSFMNERLARHYGISGVVGDHFRRVAYPEGSGRTGLLGHGSILMLTSMGTRTSPVLRGKWVMEVLLNTPPPPPPPVPALEETAGTLDGRQLTTRERLEIHRANPTCNACHQYMDPMGVALENFDVTGRWRVRESGVPVDTRGQLYDGTPVTNALELRDALLQRPVPMVRTFTLNLLAYAMGRRVEYYDQPAIRRIVRDAEADDYRISSFILGVVQSDPFQMKRAESLAADSEER